ncbi:hypothetical protein F2Q69_00061429 [Brassica cretica]|uniref:Uncharacterized protein n=1 Tax=Brassica cretica TaxID=69181 RepID=A0A8S9RQF4_BRACR|nr:hypothetical protein F2Q69_00061429 [Brassica cretica]
MFDYGFLGFELPFNLRWLLNRTTKGVELRAGHERDESWNGSSRFYRVADVLCCLIGNALIIRRELSDAVANEEEVACWSCSRVANV